MKTPSYLLCLFVCLHLFACTGNESNASDNPPSTSPDEQSAETPPVESTSPPIVNVSPTTKQPDNDNPGSTSGPLDYQALAKAYCACAENTVSINNKLAKYMDNGDNAAFEALLPEAEKAFKDAMDCCRKAKQQQSTTQVDQQKLIKPLKNTCPDLPNQLMLKMVTEIK